MTGRSLAALFLVATALPTRAQSFNVDFEPAINPHGQLPGTFGAAAQSPGYWNRVSTLPASLARLSGAASSVSVATSSFAGNWYFFWFDTVGTTGSDKALLDDVYADDTDEFHMVFTGLENGEYDVYTYLLVPPFNACLIEVMGSPDGVQTVSGYWNGGYALGSNYARHHRSVTDGTIDVRVHQTAPHGQNMIATSGIQIVKAGEVPTGTPLCFGEASPCPCSNAGGPARGCENSAGTGGAQLIATGTTSPDTVVLHSSGELPSSLSIFLQGNASLAPIPYGDGLRCAGGTLKRLYTKTAVGGAVSAPGPGDPSITARSAALGVPIPAGGRRYYQVSYRDGNAGFCPPPQGNSFNASNAVRILW